MNCKEQIRSLLDDARFGRMTSTAYDTAWIARLAELGEPIGRQALDWLREHQLADGSWGAEQPRYYHDRLICTLAAVTALARCGNENDHIRLRRARLGMDNAIKGLAADTVGETIGFEMLAPTLVTEAKDVGAIRRQDDNLLSLLLNQQRAVPVESSREALTRRRDDNLIDRLIRHRMAKMMALPAGKINREVTVAFSAEMAGNDGLKLFDIKNLQERNGSVAHSPSATAYFALNVRKNDPAALDYLRQTVLRNRDGGGVPTVSPFEVFERVWILWNLAVADPLDDEVLAWCQPHLDAVEAAWKPGLGIGFTAEYGPKGGDETSLTHEMLSRYGRHVDLDAVMRYEGEDYFRCFELEVNPSISANVHVLGALRHAGFEVEHPAVAKVLQFLKQMRFLEMLWFDKWHMSPYYPTSHVIVACAGYADEIIADSIKWIIETQKCDGSWGFYGATAEETAYCLQALITWSRCSYDVPRDVIRRGLDWLADHMDPPYSSLWIGKCLYSPTNVVRSAIVSALLLGSSY
jgi:halimadienyl-diphosphate synthase